MAVPYDVWHQADDPEQQVADAVLSVEPQRRSPDLSAPQVPEPSPNGHHAPQAQTVDSSQASLTPVHQVGGYPLSVFSRIFEAAPVQEVPLEHWLNCVRGDAETAEKVGVVRKSRDTARYDALKKQLPAITYAGTFPEGRAGKVPTTPSGLVFLELDHHDGTPPSGWLEGEKARLAAHPAVVAVYRSVGGQGLHIVAAVSPTPNSKTEYTMAWGWTGRELGVLDSGDPQVKDITRLALISHDPDAHVNLNPTPIAWEPNSLAQTKEAMQKGRRPTDSIQAFGMVAAHYCVEWTEDLAAGLRMPCPYHGGDNPAALHVWMGEREVTVKNKTLTVPALAARCWTRDCDGGIVLRFVAREVGIEWPEGLVMYQVEGPEAVEEALKLLRLDIRMDLSSGHIEVRPYEGLEPDEFLRGSGLIHRSGWIRIADSVFAQGLRFLTKKWFALRGNQAEWYDSLVVCASFSPFSTWPMQDWLNNLQAWDGEDRLGNMFADALGAERDSVLNYEAGRRLLVGAVMRVFEPGCPHDWMPILVGEQGLGKSRFCRALLPPDQEMSMYAEGIDIAASSQKVGESIGGAVIAEFSEMAGLRSPRAIEGFKSFVSERQDRYRKPWRRDPSENLRGWVGIGTTNEAAIPDDDTGSRRYLAVQCGQRADWGHVPQNRQQLWAQALSIYRTWVDAGKPGHPPNLLPPSIRDKQEQVNSQFLGVSEEFENLTQLVTDQTKGAHPTAQDGVKMAELWKQAHVLRNPETAFSHSPPPMDRHEASFASALKSQGWRRQRTRRGAVWFHP